MMVELTVCLIFSLYANVTDWKSCKIKNGACVGVFALGLVLHFVSGGVTGVLSGLFGAAIMLVLFPLFAMRMLGAGDVKALMAIGAVVGWPMADWVLIYSILGGGAIALVMMVLRRNGRKRLLYLWNYLKMCFFLQSIQSYSEKMELGEGTFRFSFGITLGVLVLVLQSIF